MQKKLDKNAAHLKKKSQAGKKLIIINRIDY